MAAPAYPRISTTSIFAPEKVQGEYLFKIDGYRLCKGLGVGNFIHSAPFAVAGYNWRIRYYPDGDTEASKDFVSVFLDLMDTDVEVRALYHLTLIEWGAPPMGQFMLESIHPLLFSSAGNTSSRGSSRFINRNILESYPEALFPDDVLRIKCGITVVKLKEAQMQTAKMGFDIQMRGAKMDFGIQVPPSNLSDNLRCLLEEGEEADVSFKVKGEVFAAHKIILAMRSAVFKAELYGPMRDKRRQSITIQDMEPAVFKALLHFIYTDELPPMEDLDDDSDKEEMIKHLLVASDRYAMERMKLMCERKLCGFLDAKTVAATLALADQHHCSKLKDACIGFINSLDRMESVVNSPGYQHLKRACPTIFIDMWEKASKKTRQTQ